MLLGWDEWDGTKGKQAGWGSVGRGSSPRPGDRQHSLGCGGMFNPGRDGRRTALRPGLSPLHRPRNDPGRRANGTGQRDGKSEASTAWVRPVPPHPYPCRVVSHQRAPPDHCDRRVSTSLAPGTEHTTCKCPSLREAAASFPHTGGNTNAPSVPKRSRRGTSSSGRKNQASGSAVPLTELNRHRERAPTSSRYYHQKRPGSLAGQSLHATTCAFAPSARQDRHPRGTKVEPASRRLNPQLNCTTPPVCFSPGARAPALP